MTFAVLRALHAIIGDALDDIQRVYVSDPFPEPRESTRSLPTEDGKKSPYASPPLTPSTSTHSSLLDFPSLDLPYDSADPAEQLTTHPAVVVASNKIVAAAGHIAAIVQTPFLSLCDASMAYHLPSCLRLLEASHTIEILREAGSTGLHVDAISRQNGVESRKLEHILRLLATHHIIRECAPNIFTMNRISSLLDSGKSVTRLRQWEREGRPEMKYHETDGISAFVGLSTDELQKSAGYMTEAYLLSRALSLRTPFQYAFGTDIGFFEWLEGEEKPVPKGNRSRHGSRDEHGVEIGVGTVGPPALGKSTDSERNPEDGNPNRYRLERFGKAMSGSVSWEVPGAVLHGFDWHALPRGSVVVDVGGGIGSTTMLLANAFSRGGGASYLSTGGGDEGLDLGLEFVIQDRQVVVEMGEKVWRAQCPELLDSGTVKFQVHDFFKTQPIKNAAVFFLRVVLHDWPDAGARMILLKLREAATDQTKLVLADFVLPLACADDVGAGNPSDHGGDALDGVEGAESMLAPAPLLANLGKASANAYWMDLTMQVTFNAQERTLREIVTLALSAGWKVIKVTRGVGSLFGHIIAVPVSIPIQKRARAGSGSALLDVPKSASSCTVGARSGNEAGQEMEFIERSASRCGTPTLGSRMDLPSVQETMAKFGGGVSRIRGPGSIGKASGLANRPGLLKPSVVLTTPPVKKKPSPLSFAPPVPTTLPPASPSPRSPATPIARRMSHAQLHRSHSQQGPDQPPPSPMSPRHPPPDILTRRASYAQLFYTSQTPSIPKSPPPPLPSSSRPPMPTSPHPRLPRRMSHAQLYQPAHAHSNSIPPTPPARPNPALSHRSSRVHLHQPSTTAPQSSIPVRQIRDDSPPPAAPVPHQLHQPTSPVSSKHTPIARRPSLAHLHVPQTPLRQRSGSIISPSSSTRSGGIGGGISMASLLGSGALKFKAYDDDGQGRHSPVAVGGSGGSVLAAAAKIGRPSPVQLAPS